MMCVLEITIAGAIFRKKIHVVEKLHIVMITFDVQCVVVSNISHKEDFK